MIRKLAFSLLNQYKKFRIWRLGLAGKTQADVHAQRISSGQAWEEFCDSLKAAGAGLVHGDAPKDGFNQAEGYRYLSRLVRAGLEAFVEFADPEFPVLKRMIHETAKIGADNPDNFYENAQISGAYEYRITGFRNTVHFLGIYTQNGNYGTSGGLQPCGAIQSEELQVEQDGSVEIILSKTPRGKNWLKIEDETTMVMVRQTFLDKQAETPAELKIECLTGPTHPAPLSAEKMDKALNMVGLFVSGTSVFFSRWSNSFKAHPNQLPLFDQEKSNNAGGDKNLVYYHSYYNLKEDECLVIHTSVPECEYWNFQLNNYWMESLDYRYLPIHVNKKSAQYNADGTVQVVVSHHPLDTANNLLTAGHLEGTMLWRWYKPDQKITPTCRVAKVSEFEKV